MGRESNDRRFCCVTNTLSKLDSYEVLNSDEMYDISGGILVTAGIKGTIAMAVFFLGLSVTVAVGVRLVGAIADRISRWLGW